MAGSSNEASPDSAPAPIADLAVIGDRRTAAVVSRDGAILWYCPRRFDFPSIFARLLDAEGGCWSVNLPKSKAGPRSYLDESGVLETTLVAPEGELTITDCMPLAGIAPVGLILRRFSLVPSDTTVVVDPRPDYAQRNPDLKWSGGNVMIDDALHLLASHELEITGGAIAFTIPKGEEGWAILADDNLSTPSPEELDSWISETVKRWNSLAEKSPFAGPYENEVYASLRAIRLLCHDESGGIIAAATSSLPEVPGADRNWDYRYAWLRDAAMIVSALVRIGGELTEARRYLDFICAAAGNSSQYPVAVFAALDGSIAQEEQQLPMSGYLDSQPVRIGNDARDQLQLDAFANVLIVAKLLYERSDDRPHWPVAEEIAEFLVQHWKEPDHGIWEEQAKHQYTSSKVIVARALEFIADFSEDADQAERWRSAGRSIREFVSNNCLTSDGAYAVYAGSDEVDVSAALFPAWAYNDADTPEMQATIAALERDWSRDGLLYWRRLECADSRKEGAFLAGTFWVAQYWVAAGDLDRARQILDAGLRYGNDVGLFSEEADPENGRMLGNIPQSFVHAAFIGAAIDLKAALEARAKKQK